MYESLGNNDSLPVLSFACYLHSILIANESFNKTRMACTNNTLIAIQGIPGMRPEDTWLPNYRASCQARSSTCTLITRRNLILSTYIHRYFSMCICVSNRVWIYLLSNFPNKHEYTISFMYFSTNERIHVNSTLF